MKKLFLIFLCLPLLAADFNGTTSKAVVNSVVFNSTVTYSVWALFNGAGENNAGRVFDGYGGKTRLLTNASAQYNFNWDGDATGFSAVTSTTFSTGVWYFICACHTAGDGGPRIYWGNATTAMAEASYGTRNSDTFTGTTQQIIIGNRDGSDRTWNGSLAHLKIHAAKLTLAQCEALRRGFEPDLANLQNYWPLDGLVTSTADPIGGATLTLTDVVGTATTIPPIVRPWGWWASLLLWPWRFPA